MFRPGLWPPRLTLVHYQESIGLSSCVWLGWQLRFVFTDQSRDGKGLVLLLLQNRKLSVSLCVCLCLSLSLSLSVSLFSLSLCHIPSQTRFFNQRMCLLSSCWVASMIGVRTTSMEWLLASLYWFSISGSSFRQVPWGNFPVSLFSAPSCHRVGSPLRYIAAIENVLAWLNHKLWGERN